MSKRNDALEAEMLGIQPAAPKTKRAFSWKRFCRRFFLFLFTLILMAIGAATLFLDAVFNGPSPTARDLMTEHLLSDSRTEWIPGLFLDLEE